MSGPTNLPSVAINLESRIFLIRGQRVMIDSDIAELYGVPVRALNQAVKRNPARFPVDFMFQMTNEEYAALRSQIVIIKDGRGKHRKYAPFVFTEHGAIGAAFILKSQRAVEMSVFVVRAFVKLREVLTAHRQLAAKLSQLEKKVGAHDAALKAVIEAIRRLTPPPPASKQKIGFAPGRKAP